MKGFCVVYRPEWHWKKNTVKYPYPTVLTPRYRYSNGVKLKIKHNTRPTLVSTMKTKRRECDSTITKGSNRRRIVQGTLKENIVCNKWPPKEIPQITYGRNYSLPRLQKEKLMLWVNLQKIFLYQLSLVGNGVSLMQPNLTCVTLDPSKISQFVSNVSNRAFWPRMRCFWQVLDEGVSNGPRQKDPLFPTNTWLLAVRLKNRTRVLRDYKLITPDVSHKNRTEESAWQTQLTCL